MKKNKLGLYIHIPFCVKKCQYCDFFSCGGTTEDERETYVNTLCAQIQAESPRYRSYEVDTVFFGGGTPSLLSSIQLSKIFSAISSFTITPDAEITIECNPGTLTEEKLETYRRLGINRLSIGLQDTHNDKLRLLGRIHTYETFLENYALARKIGFDNINIDLINSTPNQTKEELCETLKQVLALSPEHISSYSLIVEENTPFAEMDLNLPSESEQEDFYLTTADLLKQSGYEHYEISNFAKKGYRCRHNLKYWNGEEYIGFGPSAHSFFDGKRYYYDKNVLSFSEKIDEDGEKSSRQDEYIMLKLRLIDGISSTEFKQKFGVFLEEYAPNVKKYVQSGHLVLKNGAYRLTERGFLVSNYILADLIKS